MWNGNKIGSDGEGGLVEFVPNGKNSYLVKEYEPPKKKYINKASKRQKRKTQKQARKANRK